MCPEAEAILGQLAGRSDRIVPIAFHVDYFNKPWKDPFSDALYSRRQMSYNALYTKPKHPEYGLYYTPMLMIDGEQSINGRDPAGAEAAIRRALARKPQVAIGTALTLDKAKSAGTLQVRVSARSALVQGRPLLVCAVLREDGVVTRVESGENARKALKARFPARTTRYEYVELAEKDKPRTLDFAFRLEPSWDAARAGLVVFVQDKATGVIYQAAEVPWRASRAKSSSPSSSEEAVRP